MNHFRRVAVGLFFTWPLVVGAKEISNVLEDRVSLDFSQIDIRDLFQILADMRHLNLILSDLVQGNLSFRIRQADWMVVLDTLTRSRGFDYRIDQGILWIASYDEVAAMLKRKGETQKIDQVKIEVMRQVMIEARIVEAERRFAQTLGAKLAIQKKPLSIETDLTASSLHGFTSGTAAVSLLGKHATQVLNIELSALEANGLGNVVSNPRVLAANNSQALIEQGTELPYQSSAGQGATKVQFRKANLRLEVKPSIQVDDQIALEVDITKDSVGLKTEQGFAIDTKHVKTHVLVESGGTVILGGIFQETDRKDTAGVPFLSDLPLIGRLFKQEAKQLDKTELLIFLTPTLVGASKPQ